MRDEGGPAAKEYPNIPGLFGTLIAARIATLHDLQTVYCLEDAYYMYEAYAVPKYNEWRQLQHAQGRNRK